MTVDELRVRLVQLGLEYGVHNHRVLKQLGKDIAALDEIMERNFSAYWNADEMCYEQ